MRQPNDHMSAAAEPFATRIVSAVAAATMDPRRPRYLPTETALPIAAMEFCAMVTLDRRRRRGADAAGSATAADPAADASASGGDGGGSGASTPGGVRETLAREVRDCEARAREARTRDTRACDARGRLIITTLSGAMYAHRCTVDCSPAASMLE